MSDRRRSSCAARYRSVIITNSSRTSDRKGLTLPQLAITSPVREGRVDKVGWSVPSVVESAQHIVSDTIDTHGICPHFNVGLNFMLTFELAIANGQVDRKHQLCSMGVVLQASPLSFLPSTNLGII